MPKTAVHVALAGVDLDRRRPNSLAGQLYEGLRQAVLRGQIRRGERLPSTRLLAADLAVSRNTVTSAYEQLLAEGYIEAKVGSGTCVARSLPDELLSASAGAVKVHKKRGRNHSLSTRGKLLSSRPVRVLTVGGRPQPFASGLPDLHEFPFVTWARLMARHWRRPGYNLVGYGDPAGYKPLREAIAAYLRGSRAVRCETEQIVIVSGSQQALDISARLLLDPGNTALLEDPGYPGARVALLAAGASLVRLPVDAEGADIHAVQPSARPAQVAFVTPSHHFPLGVTMSITRRLALLEWAERTGAWILEDDYDSEYRYRGKPLPSLQGLDPAGRVVYMGSFSKTMFPSLRLGFIVLPAELVEAFRRARSVIDGHSPMTEQAVLADFISEGHFARHIRRMRALYAERQSALVETAGRELAGRLEVRPSDGGMHLVGWLPEGADDVKASEKALAQGVYTRPLSSCSASKVRRGGLLLGYAALTIPQIREGVRKLAQALR
ncbi:MAG TPA: PLP-dependent aminotransferase family protein [Terriglobales bacterium]|nr:PLP-dependent aminotransferase family protein [Terriglobales bacterium]